MTTLSATLRPPAETPLLDRSRGTDLLGVPQAVISQLTVLRERAHQRILNLPQWRAEHAAVVEGLTCVPDVERLGELRELTLEAALAAEEREWELREAEGTAGRHGGGDPGPPHLVALTTCADARALAESMWSLHRQLDVLEGPPTDAMVTTDLPESDLDTRDSLVNYSPHVRAELSARLDEREALHRAWLADINGTSCETCPGPGR